MKKKALQPVELTEAQQALLSFFSKEDTPHRLKSFLYLQNYIWTTSEQAGEVQLGKVHSEGFYFFNELQSLMLDIIID